MKKYIKSSTVSHGLRVDYTKYRSWEDVQEDVFSYIDELSEVAADILAAIPYKDAYIYVSRFNSRNGDMIDLEVYVQFMKDIQPQLVYDIVIDPNKEYAEWPSMDTVKNTFWSSFRM